MGLQIVKDRCVNNNCHPKRTMATIDLKCPRCGYDYYEEIYGHVRPPDNQSEMLYLRLKKLFGEA